MARLDTWSTTAGSNSDPAPDGFAEGMKASDFNNCMREEMAQIRVAWEEIDWRNFYGATTATYQSATTFDIDDAYQSEFTVGRRLRLGVPDPTFVYGRVVSESTATGTTTVTVAIDAGDAATWAASGASLDTVYLGRAERSIGPADGVLDTVPGTAAAPALILGGDIDTGAYSKAANTIGLSTAGTLRMDISTTAVTSALPVIIPAGSAAAPSLTITGETDTGVYGIGSDNIGISLGGTLHFDVSTTAATFLVPARLPVGLVGTPSLYLGGDTNTGLYRVTGDQLGVTAGGVLAGSFDAAGIIIEDGAEGAPSLSFGSQRNTGLYYQGTNTIRMTTNATTALTVSDVIVRMHNEAEALDGLLLNDASASEPSLRFTTNPDMGIYYEDGVGPATEEGFAIAVGGAQVARIPTTTPTVFRMMNTGGVNDAGVVVGDTSAYGGLFARQGAGTDGDPNGFYLHGHNDDTSANFIKALRWTSTNDKGWSIGPAIWNDDDALLTKSEIQTLIDTSIAVQHP